MHWEDLLLFSNRVTVGTVDPVIGRISASTCSVCRFGNCCNGFAGFMLLATTVLVGAVYFVRGGITLTERGAVVDAKVRRHLAVLVGIFSPA